MLPQLTRWKRLRWLLLTLVVAIAILWLSPHADISQPTGRDGTQPLVLAGGDPYTRALMRTISASEANDPQPYSLLYGGDRFYDFSRHPQRCVPIVAGPNIGNCTTAAGRYQFINTTWYEQAARYHPQGKHGFLWWKTYSFAPQYQDAVVYGWLRDRSAWDADIPQLLRDDELETVLRLLSSTWTSLGYGIETNVMSRHLPSIYQRLVREELTLFDRKN
jgi:muramidase (phage lysozyme)